MRRCGRVRPPADSRCTRKRDRYDPEAISQGRGAFSDIIEGKGGGVVSLRLTNAVNSVDVQRFCQSNGAATLSVSRWPPEGAVASFRRPGTPLART